MEQPCQPADNPPVVKPLSPAAERMRRHRERRRNGLRSFNVDLRETEIDELVRRGLLKPEGRHDQNSIIAALYTFLDQVFSKM
jgi:hypothetical protein